MNRPRTFIDIELRVNGDLHHLSVPARKTLADILREDLGLRGTHLGCEHGVCGACTVLFEDLPTRSCLVLAGQADGCEVTTVEGLNSPESNRLRDEMSSNGGLQCGFCTSGMLITGTDLIRRLEPLSSDRVRHELAGNLCRCTGYRGIVRAICATNCHLLGCNSDTTPKD